MKKIDQRLNDYDLKTILGYEGIKEEAVKKVMACVFGENDGPSWHYILQMKDGRYVYLTGWCDYTGWGCQDGSDSGWHKKLERALEEAPVHEPYHKDINVREQLKKQIEGKQPYGLSV